MNYKLLVLICVYQYLTMNSSINITIELLDLDSNPINNLTIYNRDEQCDCQLVFKVNGYQIGKFITSIYDLYEIFALKYNPNISSQQFTFLNSNGFIGINKNNNTLEFEVSRYGGDRYGEITISIPINEQIDKLVNTIKMICNNS